MGIKERREREKAELRDKILVAARELFVEEGFDAVTMRKIAERIEYSPTALYLHFETKDEILRVLCDEDFRALAGHFAGIAALPDPIERLRAAGHAYVQFGLQFPNHYRLMFMTPHPRQEAEESAIAKGDPDQDSYAFLKGILAECVELGLFRPELQDVELLAQVVWAAVHGVVSIEIAKCNDDWVDWRPFAVRADFLLDALLNGLLVAPNPSADTEVGRYTTGSPGTEA